MLALVRSSTLVGIDAVTVDVECIIATGQLPSFNIVGLPTAAVKEGAVRVRSALGSVGHDIPAKKVTVNLAPADLRKPGSALDLPTALSILVADGRCPGESLDGLLVLGELGLDGSVRRVPGVLASAMLARERGLRGVIVPDACAAEALVVDDIEIYGAAHLQQIVDALTLGSPLPAPTKASTTRRRRRRREPADMAEVRDQAFARQAIEIAVAGSHNLLLSGPPGVGKTMLARRIPGLLPAMTREESLETTKIYSSIGLAEQGLIDERPFRAPHHTISGAALLGGGTLPRPGEISLAHNGVLFLDELPEFARAPIEALRQPLEERSVTIARVNGTLHLPASFMLVAAANPCPCGWLGSDLRECTCGPGSIDRYRSRLSGPLLDRIDLQVLVGPVSIHELRSGAPGEPSAKIRERVLAARDRQRARFAQHGIRCNAEMTSRVLNETCRLDSRCERALVQIVEERKWMSARSVSRIIKVARTIADLIGHDQIEPDDLFEAAGYRAVDPLADIALAAAPREDKREPRLVQQRGRGATRSKSAPSTSATESRDTGPTTTESEATDVVTGEAAYTELGLAVETAAILSAAGFAAQARSAATSEVTAAAETPASPTSTPAPAAMAISSSASAASALADDDVPGTSESLLSAAHVAPAPPSIERLLP